MPMGQNTTTFNVDELITAYIDNQISDVQLKKQIEEMLSKDEKLNAKYKAELLTKNLLSSRLTEVAVPEAAYTKLNASINNLILQQGTGGSYQKAPAEYPSFWATVKQALTPRMFGLPRYAYALVLVLILGAFFVISNSGDKTVNPHILAGTEKSVMVQAVNSFHKILSGDVKPQLATSNAAEIEKYVKENSHFDAFVPKIDNYELKGVVCNEYNGQKLAHIIYENSDDEVIYIYQTTVAAVHKKELELPDDVQNEIIKTKFYMCDGVDDNNCTMTLWFKGSLICVSMTTLPKTEMHSTFAGFNK